jgi:hypothetical protein
MAINLKAFAKSLTYQADTSVEQIYKDFKELEEIQEFAEQKIAYFKNLMGLCGYGAALVSVGLVIGLSTNSLNWTMFTFYLLFIITGFLLFWSSKEDYYSKLKLPEERYELLKKIVLMVNRDLAPNSKLKILVRFTLPNGKTGEKIKTLPHPRKRGWNVDMFEERWLALEGKFIDTTNFLLTITKMKTRAYGKNANGKSKSKDKPKGTEINLKLNFPSKRYGCMNFLREATQSGVKLPEGVQLKRLKVTPKAIDLTVQFYGNHGTEHLYKTITMMFLSLYQVLNFAKILSRKRQALPET